jgi:hypothetical protein
MSRWVPERMQDYSPFRYESQDVSVVVHFRALSDDTAKYWVSVAAKAQ